METWHFICTCGFRFTVKHQPFYVATHEYCPGCRQVVKIKDAVVPEPPKENSV